MKPSTRLASLTHSDASEGVEGLRSLSYARKTRQLDKGSPARRAISFLSRRSRTRLTADIRGRLARVGVAAPHHVGAHRAKDQQHNCGREYPHHAHFAFVFGGLFLGFRHGSLLNTESPRGRNAVGAEECHLLIDTSRLVTR